MKRLATYIALTLGAYACVWLIIILLMVFGVNRIPAMASFILSPIIAWSTFPAICWRPISKRKLAYAVCWLLIAYLASGLALESKLRLWSDSYGIHHFILFFSVAAALSFEAFSRFVIKGQSRAGA